MKTCVVLVLLVLSTTTLSSASAKSPKLSEYFTATQSELPSIIRRQLEDEQPFKYPGKTVDAFQPHPLRISELAKGGFLLGWTDTDGNAHVARFDNGDRYVSDTQLGKGILRALLTEADGAFVAVTHVKPALHITKYSADATQVWTKTMETNRATDNILGGVEIVANPAAGTYWTYYKVHGKTSSQVCPGFEGHEGDSVKTYNMTTGAETVVNCWGCSHSLAQRLSFFPQSNKVIRACVTDCYPGTADLAKPLGGIYLQENAKFPVNTKLYANCGGKTAGDLGSFVTVGNEHRLTFTATRKSFSPGEDFPAGTLYSVGMVTIQYNGEDPSSSNLVWLTDAKTNAPITGSSKLGGTDILVGFVKQLDTTREYVFRTFSTSGKGHGEEESIKAPFVERDGLFSMSNGDVVWAYPDIPTVEWFNYKKGADTAKINIYRIKAAGASSAATTTISITLCVIAFIATLIL